MRPQAAGDAGVGHGVHPCATFILSQ
jgi:hypothetical protein